MIEILLKRLPSIACSRIFKRGRTLWNLRIRPGEKLQLELCQLSNGADVALESPEPIGLPITSISFWNGSRAIRWYHHFELCKPYCKPSNACTVSAHSFRKIMKINLLLSKYFWPREHGQIAISKYVATKLRVAYLRAIE